MANYHRGEQCNGKLTEDAVLRIRANLSRAERLRAELEEYTCAAIADREGVSEVSIKNIKQGRTWRHVK